MLGVSFSFSTCLFSETLSPKMVTIVYFFPPGKVGDIAVSHSTRNNYECLSLSRFIVFTFDWIALIAMVWNIEEPQNFRQTSRQILLWQSNPNKRHIRI